VKEEEFVNQNQNLPPLEILLVQDRPGGPHLDVTEGKSQGFPRKIHTGSNSQEALSFMRREDSYGSAPHPDILIVDVDRAFLNQSEFFSMMKKEGETQNIPMIVCSPTPSLDSSYYVLKPLTFPQIVSLVNFLKKFRLDYA